MPSSVLSGGSPRRLFLHGGKWVLEVVRHVNLGQDLIRPTTERLTGHRAITTYFKNNPDKAQLGKAAQRVMQSGLDGDTSSYTAEGTDWIANSMLPPPPGVQRGSFRPPPDAPPLELLVGELEARVVALTAVQEGLLARLARLEAKVAAGGGSLGPGRARQGARPGARSASGGGEPHDGDAAEDAPAASDGFEGELDSASDRERGGAGSEREHGGRADRERGGAGGGSERERGDGAGASRERGDANSERERGGGSERERAASGADPGGDSGSANEPADAAASASDEAEVPEEEEIVEETGPSPPRILLTLPPVHELTKCVALLVGGEVTAKEGDPKLPVNRTTKDCYAAAILDDNDQTVGMILMDLKATVFLGGTLMMLPRTEIEQQLKALAPGEDSIAASAEICNALSGAINGFQGQHVRVGSLQKFEFKAWSWVTKPYDRRDLEDSFGGRTVVASRPPPVQIG